ncbi:helix-turn-helix transcriptional regulator [Shimia sp. R11_0]|nr:helix-turn-helix transcriptional regulator [Shimia sp. R11_0]
MARPQAGFDTPPSFSTPHGTQSPSPTEAPQPSSQIRVMTLAQLTQGAPWVLEKLHLRDHHLLLWTTRGQGRLLLHGQRRGFGAHNAVFVPAGKLLAFELGLQVQGLATLIPDDGHVPLPSQPQHLRLQDSKSQAELTATLDALRRELEEQRPFMAEALTAQARLMSVALRRSIDAAGTAPKERAADRIVRRFCDCLAKEFATGNPMAWYAEQLDITPTHLTRACRQSAGITAAEMLSQVVQHRAHSLLRAGNWPIKKIATSLGFGSAAYFTRFCQKHFGASPSQIRKAMHSP